MSSITFETNDGSFSVLATLACLNGTCYIEKSDYEYTMQKAFDEIEKYKKAFDDAKVEKDKTVCEMQAHIECLKAELAEVQLNKTDLTYAPIEAAAYLINRSFPYTSFLSKEQECKAYNTSALRQIAEHLLVYCNNEEDG